MRGQQDGVIRWGRFSPWLDVCVRPRVTFRAILDEDPDRHVTVLTALGASGAILAWLGWKWRFAYSEWVVIVAPFVLTFLLPLALVIVWLMTGFLTLSCRLVGGHGTWRATRSAVGWACAPLLALLPVLAIAIFANAWSGFDDWGRPSIAALLIGAVSAWSAGVLLVGLAVAHGFSGSRALGAVTLLGMTLLCVRLLFSVGSSILAGRAWTNIFPPLGG